MFSPDCWGFSNNKFLLNSVCRDIGSQITKLSTTANKICVDDLMYFSMKEFRFFVSMFWCAYIEQQNREIELKTKSRK